MLENKKNQAFLIYSEWGPYLRTPRDKRLADMFPEVKECARLQWINEFEEVDKEIWKFAEQGGVSKYTEESFSVAFRRLFPWMNDESIRQAYGRTCYYAWHEGWDGEAEKEYDAYMSKSASELECDIRMKRYGTHYTIWRAVTQKSSLASIGWVLFNILNSDEDDLIRYHCAQTLISLLEIDPEEIQPVHLSARRKYNVNQYLQYVKSIIEKKIGEQ